MTQFDRLKGIVSNDPRFSASANETMYSILRGHVPAYKALSYMADNLCAHFGLSGEVTHNAAVFYHLGSRGKAPAAIVVSMNAGQPASPSAMLERRTQHALIQVFEGDADDRDVAGGGENSRHWLETKGRVLLH